MRSFCTAITTLNCLCRYLNPKCVASEPHKDRCWDASVVQQYIKTPLFVAQNMYDQNQINDILLCPAPVCAAGTTHVVAQGFMDDFAAKTVATVRAILGNHSDAGAFVPSCFEHTSDLCMTEGPKIGGLGYADLLGAWFFGTPGKKTILFDDCTGRVCNADCSGNCQDS
jgi:hypothetical protein